MPRLPVVFKTAWVNPANRPEKFTAKSNPTRVRSSAQASIGGRAVHMVAHGIEAVLTAPRPHADIAIAAPLAKQKKRQKQRGAPPPIPSQCPECGQWFPSRNARGQHQYLCARGMLTRVWVAGA